MECLNFILLRDLSHPSSFFTTRASEVGEKSNSVSIHEANLARLKKPAKSKKKNAAPENKSVKTEENKFRS